MEVFTVKNLTFVYSDRNTAAINDMSLTVNEGDFFVLCGASGSGKSTLLRNLKPSAAPYGARNGEILFENTDLYSLDVRRQASEIGFIDQSCENQLVTDKVWHELAFGLESLGMDTPSIRRRVTETASFFGIQNWFYKKVDELSGGQKQMLNLASIMVMQPKVLILDEPTAQLDPIAAANFLNVLGKINSELGTTVILTEHRLDEAFARANRVAVLDNGSVICEGTPQEVGESLKELKHTMFLSMPVPMRIWAATDGMPPCPVSVKDGREWLKEYIHDNHVGNVPDDTPEQLTSEYAVEADNLWFKYEKELPDIIKGLSLKVRKGEFFAILGGNGTGKTTALKLISGIKKPYRGKMNISGRIGLLSQNPQTMFLRNSVKEDMEEMLSFGNLPKGQEKIERVMSLCCLEGLENVHPYDLSGGEMQRAALAKLLLMEPDILLMDEPTKGLDAGFKRDFAEIIKKLNAEGRTVIMVSHDIEFCAEYADRCAMFFDGNIIACERPRKFFTDNSFYTTAANRMARGIIPLAVTAKDVIYALGGEGRVECEVNNKPAKAEKKEEPPINKKPGVNKRTLAAAITVLALIPLTVLMGVYYFDDRKYYFISLLVLLEGMLPFFMIFEGRRPQAKELVITASMCALAVAGRIAFFMLPQFKPSMAVTIISGVVLGGETGFLVGAVTMLVSNMIMGQGSWTPWQMFAMGICGWLAGVLFRKGIKKNGIIPLLIYGFLSTLIIYGGIMNASTALLVTGTISVGAFLTYCISGFPMDLVHAGSTVFFLLAAARPMIEKLERIKEKYGINT